MSENTPVDAAALGITVAGFLRGGLGLGEASRLYVTALQAAGVPVRTITVDPQMPLASESGVAKTVDFQDVDSEDDTPFNLVCVNPPEMPAVYSGLGSGFFDGHHSIGVLAWEVSRVPPEWSYTFDLLDEVWVYSDYVRDIFENARPGVPVVTMPLPVVPRALDGVTAPDFGLGPGFTFLFLFDFNSTMQRKNPQGLIEAFTRAFAPGEGPQLLIKSINGDYRPDRLRELVRLADRHPDVHIVDAYVSAEEKDALIASCGCYVSLHRAEGFGLTLAEAMAYGRPVLASRFSGNLDFMDDDNSFLVDCESTAVGSRGEHYPADARWAEPDLDHAASLMRQVSQDEEERNRRAERGRTHVLEHLSVDRVAARARGRLEEVVAEGPVGVRAFGRMRPPPPPAGLAPVLHAESMLGHGVGGYTSDASTLKNRWRDLVLKLIRPFTVFEQGLDQSTVRGLREVVDRLGMVHAGLRDLQAQGGMVENRELVSVIEGSRARPAAGHPAISRLDGGGKRVLAFDVADDPEADYGFEDVFRGSEAAIRKRQEIYPDLLGEPARVVDLGCGRGEFLDILRERGIPATGVELDQRLVDYCTAKGHDAVHADAIAYLESLEDRSVPALFAAQVVEHLPADVLRSFLSLAERKLTPGGKAIFETVNPHMPTALKAFWTDPTHHHPLYPEVLLALSRFAGFAAGEVVFPASRGDLEQDVYESPDYAVVLTASGR